MLIYRIAGGLENPIQLICVAATKELDAAFSAAVKGIFDEATIQKNVADIKVRQDKAKKILDKVDKTDRKFIDDGLAILELLKGIEKAYQKASPEHQAELLRVLFVDITFTGGKFQFTPHAVFAPLFESRHDKGRLAKLCEAFMAGLINIPHSLQLAQLGRALAGAA